MSCRDADPRLYREMKLLPLFAVAALVAAITFLGWIFPSETLAYAGKIYATESWNEASYTYPDISYNPITKKYLPVWLQDQIWYADVDYACPTNAHQDGQ